MGLAGGSSTAECFSLKRLSTDGPPTSTFSNTMLFTILESRLYFSEALLYLLGSSTVSIYDLDRFSGTIMFFSHFNSHASAYRSRASVFPCRRFEYYNDTYTQMPRRYNRTKYLSAFNPFLLYDLHCKMKPTNIHILHISPCSISISNKDTIDSEEELSFSCRTLLDLVIEIRRRPSSYSAEIIPFKDRGIESPITHFFFDCLPMGVPKLYTDEL